MARDIEEFLRRAAERRKQQQHQQNQPAPSQRVREIVETGEVEVVREEPVEIIRPRKQKQTKARQRAAQQRDRDLRHESVAEHVKSHIDSSDIAEHAEHLGDRIQSTNQRVASRLQKKFEHDVSKIDDLPSVQDDHVASVTQGAVSQAAKDLVAMFRSPQSVRQAIMISEILKRPNFD